MMIFQFVLHASARRCGVVMLLCIATFLFPSVACIAQEKPADDTARAGRETHPAQWMHDAGWGVFYHSLSNIYSARHAVSDFGYEQLTRPSGHPHVVMHRLGFFQQNLPILEQQQWNDYVDGFDVDALARQLHEVGAGWFMIAIGQNSGLFCAPNAELDRMMGFDQSTTTCSERDLVADMARALKPYNIRLLVYATPHPPAGHGPIIEFFGNVQGVMAPQTQEKWESVLRHWSHQWGDLVDGWWFDGGYTVAIRDEAPNRESIIDAAKAGNPKAIVCLNPGVVIAPGANNEDYTAGELDFPLGVVPESRWLGHRQWHILSYLGEWWSWSAKPRFEDDQVIETTFRIIAAGGAVTWDVPLNIDGTLQQAFHDQLLALGEALKDRESLRAQYLEPWLHHDPIPAGNLASFKPARLLTVDGSTTLPASLNRRAQQGNDGDPQTVAQAGGQWPWTYEVDLIDPADVQRIVVNFGEGYATHFDIAASTDQRIWHMLHSRQDHDGSTVDITIEPMTARYIRVIGRKPDGPNQHGEQMMIAELQVFE